MGNELRPGNLGVIPNDYSQFINSMASSMEQELNNLMTLDGLPALSMDVNDESIRDRRRLFVAIARGIVKHLAENKDAIDIELPDAINLPVTVQPKTIRTDGV